MKVIKLDEVRMTPQQLLDRFYEYNGFNKDGEGWIVCGNTYDIKDDLKALGGKFNGTIKHWIIPVDDERYSTIQVKADVLFEKNPSSGVLDYRYPVYPPNQELMTQILAADAQEQQKVQAEKKQRAQAAGINSHYMCKVGDRVTFNIKSIELKSTFPSQYGGEGGLYEIVDTDGNYYIWYSSSVFRDVSWVKSITGTIKGYKEYNGIEQTVLTRCKFFKEASYLIKNRPTTQEPVEQSPVEQPIEQQVQQENPNEMPTFDMSLFM